MIEKINKISFLFSQHNNLFYCEANKFFIKDLNADIEKYCTSNNIIITNEIEHHLIKIKSYLKIENVFCFDKLEQYFDCGHLKKSFCVFDNTGNYCYHDPLKLTYFWNDKVDENFKLTCTNLFSYYKFYSYLISEDFADHHNDANTEIVIYSSANGIFRITYDTLPQNDFNFDISAFVEELISISTPVQIRSFFKNALFTFSNGKGYIAISEIIKEANQIVDTTKRDFELASKEFNFDRFRDALIKEKEKYFNSIREIINKIFSQAIGIPISISASVFATYKVDNDSFMLFIVLLAFALYVAFYIKFQFIYKNELIDLNTDFERDFEIIKYKSGLPIESIKFEKEKIEKKIQKSILMINWLIGLVIAMGFLVFFYILYQISLSQTILLIKRIIHIVF